MTTDVVKQDNSCGEIAQQVWGSIATVVDK